MSLRRRNSPIRQGLRSEPLEPRAMLAGHGFGDILPPAFHAFLLDGLRQASQGSPAAALFTGASLNTRDGVFSTLGSYASDKTVLTATLSDADTGATAKVTYKTYTEDSTAETELKVTVTGAEADSTLDVTVGDTVVGQVTTDSNGDGSLVLSSDPEGDEQPLPDDFPTDVAAGTAVSVGALAGTLETPTGPGSGDCGHGQGTGTRLRAALSDSDTGAAATVRYVTRTINDVTTTRLVVKVTGAEADSTLDVSIGDTVVGQVTTDSSGDGKLVLSSDPVDDEQPLPADFPADIAAGTAVTVGTMTGTFDTAYGGGFHFGRHHR